MSKRLWYIVGVAAVLAPGCGGPEGPGQLREPAAVVTPKAVESPAAPERSVAALLDRPRPELAELGDVWLEKVRRKQTLYRQASVRFELLPDERLPLAVPIWRQAKYSAKEGLSLPPYLAEGQRDPGLAEHLARFGDGEAARRLAAGGDPALAARLDGLRLDRNYPAEWTRLVALMLYHAEFRVAAGDADAVGDLLRLHEDLGKALGGKAKVGPLGAALLPRGWGVLHDTAAAWKAAGKEEQARQVERALSLWGEAPALRPGLPPGTPRAEVARLLGGAARGRALLAPSALRALDVLGLPLPDEQAEAVVACLDGTDRLSDVLVTYQSGLSEAYPRPAQLAHLLEEHTIGEQLRGDLPARRYLLSGVVCEVVLTPGSPFVGGVVRLGGKAAADPPVLPRDLGPVHLDRSFALNRFRLAPQQAGGRAVVKDARALAALRLPLPGGERGEAVLQREAAADVVARLTVSFKPRQQRRTLAELALPLWQAAGPGRLDARGKDGGLVLAWEDAQTRYALTLPPTEDDVPALEVADRQAGQDVGRRAELAAAFDRRERRERVGKREPLTRLPRELNGLRLGTPRAALLSHLPAGEGVLKRELPDGVLVTVAGTPVDGAAGLRELYVHFDRAGRADALRARYADGPGSAAGTLPRSVQAAAGAADTVTAGEGWRCSAWQDDRTGLACRREGPGLDVTLWDRPADQDDAGRPALAYLPRGAGGCDLGRSGAEIAQGAGGSEPAKSGEPLVLRPKGDGPYDALLVWLEAGRVVRVVARHRLPDESGMAPARAGQALAEAWGREAATLGWPRRQDARGGVARSWANHDDRTEVRVFWQQAPAESPRLYTEWRDRVRP